MIQLNHGYRKRFITKLAGIATAADATPTAILYRNGSASGVTVTVSTTAETGVYVATFTTLDVGDNWARADHLELLVSATIDGDSGYKAVLWDSDSDPDAPMRGTDGANTVTPLDATQTQSAAAAAITAAGLATGTNVTDARDSILNRIGAFAGTGVNTILGFLQAIMRKDVSVPSEVGGDYDPATDSQEAIAEAIGDIEGDSSVNVLPAVGISADRSPGVTLKAFVGETITQSITLYETNGTTPIVLTGKTLVVVFETRQGVDVATVANSNITVGGDDDNVISFAYPAAATASERVLKFALRDAGSPNTVYLQGLLSVQRAPKVD